VKIQIEDNYRGEANVPTALGRERGGRGSFYFSREVNRSHPTRLKKKTEALRSSVGGDGKKKKNHGEGQRDGHEYLALFLSPEKERSQTEGKKR